jgi:hypothetical protein
MLIRFPVIVTPEVTVFGQHGFDDTISHDLAESFWGEIR